MQFNWRQIRTIRLGTKSADAESGLSYYEQSGGNATDAQSGSLNGEQEKLYSATDELRQSDEKK